MVKDRDTWYASWKFSDSYPAGFYGDMAPYYDTKASALRLAKNRGVHDEDMPQDGTHLEIPAGTVTRTLKAKECYHDFYYVFIERVGWVWFGSMEDLCAFLSKGTLAPLDGFIEDEVRSVDDWLGSSPKKYLRDEDASDEKLFAQALLNPKKFYSFMKDRALEDLANHDENLSYFYADYIKKHLREYLEKLRIAILKKYKMTSMKESVEEKPALILCDHCFRGIRSRGEDLTEDEYVEIDEDEDEFATCDWCGETFEATELKAYRAYPKPKTKKIDITFEGIDSWHRPVFVDLKTKKRYGSVYMLFSYDAIEDDVLAKIAPFDLCYFGNRFDCEPMGSPAEGLNIVRKD